MRKNRICFIIFVLFAFGNLFCSVQASQKELVVTDLRCEYVVNPLGIEVLKPRLSWKLISSSRAVQQSAFQILVASSMELLNKNIGDLWDSKRVVSNNSSNINYAGKNLTSGNAYYWKVSVWKGDDNNSIWSNPASWEMGILNSDDWKASWITPDSCIAGNEEPYLRHEFLLASDPQKAKVRVNVLGWFELYVNGEKVSADVMSPATTDFSTRSLYLSYDLKPYLHKGKNCIGLWVSRGWFWKGRTKGVTYDRPLARLQLDLLLDGKTQTIGTNGNWQCKKSGRSVSGEWGHNGFGGEKVDARLSEPLWCTPKYIVSDWLPVKVIAPPALLAQTQLSPTDRILKTVPAISCTKLKDSVYTYDFGTNLTGWVELHFPRLKAGEVLKLHYIDKIATLKEFEKFGQYDEFISAGKEGESFINKFNYHGFRCVTIKGLPSELSLQDVKALSTGANWEAVGNFECSDTLINRMHKVNMSTLHALSMNGIMADCPHAERKGYGDAQTSIESCVMNFDMQPFYDKWQTDWRDVQEINGNLPHSAPNRGGGGGPAWGGTLQQLAFRQYLYYNDFQALEKNYIACHRYIKSLESHQVEGLLKPFGISEMWDDLGEWVPAFPPGERKGWNFPSREEADFFNNCYLVFLTDQLAKMATILNKTEDARSLASSVDSLRMRIHAAYYKSDKKLYVNNKQSYLLMPLLTGITPDSSLTSVMQTLENSILIQNKGHLDTGMLGTYFLIRYLQDIGRNDLLWTIITQTSYPGWGYMLENGATTWWEQWHGGRSSIHSCYGMLDSWFYESLAGIQPDPQMPGFKKIIIKPAIVGNLTWVKANYNSIQGNIVSQWKRNGNNLTLHVEIPANTTATIYVPAVSPEAVIEHGVQASCSEGIRFLRMENKVAVYELVSGNYNFTTIF